MKIFHEKTAGRVAAEQHDERKKRKNSPKYGVALSILPFQFFTQTRRHHVFMRTSLVGRSVVHVLHLFNIGKTGVTIPAHLLSYGESTRSVHVSRVFFLFFFLFSTFWQSKTLHGWYTSRKTLNCLFIVIPSIIFTYGRLFYYNDHFKVHVINETFPHKVIRFLRTHS